jgi:hypothetical protein
MDVEIFLFSSAKSIPVPHLKFMDMLLRKVDKPPGYYPDNFL